MLPLPQGSRAWCQENPTACDFAHRKWREHVSEYLLLPAVQEMLSFLIQLSLLKWSARLCDWERVGAQGHNCVPLVYLYQRDTTNSFTLLRTRWSVDSIKKANHETLGMPYLTRIMRTLNFVHLRHIYNLPRLAPSMSFYGQWKLALADG